jgi:hypothetical protein
MMLLAVLTHIRRREPAAVAFTTMLLLAAAVVGLKPARPVLVRNQRNPRHTLLTTTTAKEEIPCVLSQ